MLAAQVGASMYGVNMDDNLKATINFVKSFEEKHKDLYNIMHGDRLPPPDSREWSGTGSVEIRNRFIIAAFDAHQRIIQDDSDGLL